MLISWLMLLSTITYSAEKTGPIDQPKSQTHERNFYDVLEDVLGDFEYDLKNGNVIGLRNLAVRNIGTSENVPPSFKTHLELLVTEKILKTSKSNIIQCLQCKSRKTTLNGDQMVITTADTNPAELARIAKLSNIEHFMDIAFLYTPTGMILSMYITMPDSGTILWSHSYNSETSRASAFRRGVDYSQIDEARKETEYVPMNQTRLILYYLFEPDLPSTAGCLTLGLRSVERYDNRKKEVGFEANYMTNASTIVSNANKASEDVYGGFGFNLTLLFLHSWNFIGEEENYNTMRGSFTAGIGGTYASGYLSGLIRGGYEWRMAKRFGITFVLGYRPPSTAFLAGTPSGSISGPEFGLGVNFVF